MNTRLGLSYRGSKRRIAGKIVGMLPPGEVLYDPMAGGCAVVHAALLAGKWSSIVAQDVNDVPQLFVAAARGRYRGERRWISRDDFFRLKDSDPYVRTVWSFSNNQRDYVYGCSMEPYKRALWLAVVDGEMDELRELYPEVVPAVGKALASSPGDIHSRYIAVKHALSSSLLSLMSSAPSLPPLFAKVLRRGGATNYASLRSLRNLRSLQSLESLERLQSLESLQSLQSLQSLEHLEVRRGSYDLMDYEPGSVIYCDPPYKGTSGYPGSDDFDHERFYDWCCRMAAGGYKVYISELQMPEDRFSTVAEFALTHNCCPGRRKKVVERLFTPRLPVLP